MKKLTSLLMVFILMLVMSINVFAWSSSDWWSNIAADEIVSGAPNAAVASHQRYIMVYNANDGLYYKLVNAGTAYAVNFYIVSNTGSVTMTNNNRTDFSVYSYSNETWSQVSIDGVKVFTQYDLSNCLFVNGTAGINIDDVLLEYDYENGKLTADGEEIQREHGGGGADLDTEDVNKSILEQIVDFFNGFADLIKDALTELFGAIIDFFKFLFDMVIELGKLFMELPKLLTNLLELKDSLYGTLDTILIQSDGANPKVKAIIMLSGISLIIAIVNVFLKLFAGSKLGGD